MPTGQSCQPSFTCWYSVLNGYSGRGYTAYTNGTSIRSQVGQDAGIIKAILDPLFPKG